MSNKLPRIAAIGGIAGLITMGGLTAVAVATTGGQETVPVSGEGIHYFTTAVVHSQQEIETGMLQRSTDIIRLTGDLDGYLLYHPTSEFDFANQKLVNTGTQFFSGTIAGSEPMVLHDDTFRFDVDLATGQTTGEVHLMRSKDAPDQGQWYECHLAVTGTGMTPEGDATFTYTGHCLRRGRP